jgi:hypothetical protein
MKIKFESFYLNKFKYEYAPAPPIAAGKHNTIAANHDCHSTNREPQW